MSTYLYFHSLRTDSSQHRYRDRYELRHVDYELTRSVNSKGEVASDVSGGQIRAVLDGFGDDHLFHWLFRPDIEENGEIVTLDIHERTIETFSFSRAKAVGYRLHFDAHAKDSVAAVLTIEASEIATDNELTYEHR